jgi:hypothetical protein
VPVLATGEELGHLLVMLVELAGLGIRIAWYSGGYQPQ